MSDNNYEKFKNLVNLCAMHFANEYEQEFKEEFFYNNPDMVK
jgi:hypothetical protein